MRSLGLVGACAGLAAFAGLGRLCALAGGRFCWACGRVWAAVGGRLLALLLGLVGACGRLGGRFCWAHHVWVGAFAGLPACGRYCWDCGAGLWALLLACGRLLALAGALALLRGLLGLLALLGLVLVGAFAVWALLWALLLGLWRWVFVGAFAGLVGACGLSCSCGRFRWACRRLVGACGLSWGCGRFRWACGRFCWACERLRALAGGRCLKTMRVPPDDRKPGPKANVSELLVKDALLNYP